MQDLKTYLSTAPVLAISWFIFLVGLLIEINRFFPDALTLSLFPFFNFCPPLKARGKKIVLD
jgi:photosystem I subunit 9